MRRFLLQGVLLLALAGVVAIAGAALTEKPAEAAGQGWTPCPFPPCLAPCVLGAEPTVLCKERGAGKPFPTTFACCCCGGSEGTRYKPL